MNNEENNQEYWDDLVQKGFAELMAEIDTESQEYLKEREETMALLESIPDLGTLIYENKHLITAIDAYAKSKYGTRTGGSPMVESLVFEIMREFGKAMEESALRSPGYAISL
jgi:hypothetical protein